MSSEQTESIKQCLAFVKAMKAQPLGGLFPNDQNRVRWALRDLEMVFKPYLDGSNSEEASIPRPDISKLGKANKG
jgi:hypothetical protein